MTCCGIALDPGVGRNDQGRTHHANVARNEVRTQRHVGVDTESAREGEEGGEDGHIYVPSLNFIFEIPSLPQK